MAMRYGALVGAVKQAGGAKQVSNVYENSKDSIIVRDKIELSAAPINDTILLASVPSSTVLDPHGCILYFDDLGTSVTFDVGDANDPDGLTAATDVASAAGVFSIMKTVDISNYYEPVWKQLGYAKDPNKVLDIYVTIKGGAATGTVVWTLKGAKR